MSELAILLARVSYISKFSTSLLKFFLKISASSIFLLIVLLLLFKITDSLWKAFSEKRRTTVFPIFLLTETTLWSSFPKKHLLVLRSKLSQKLLWRLKRSLGSLFLVFKNLFLSFDLFTITFLSSLVIKLQFFESIYFIFFGACLSRTNNTVSLSFDVGAFVKSHFNNSFFKGTLMHIWKSSYVF